MFDISSIFFNQKVDNLPISLASLELGHDFDQTIDNLPISLTSLELGDHFKKK